MNKLNKRQEIELNSLRRYKKNTQISLENALETLKTNSQSNIKSESINLTIHLSIDPKQTSQIIRGSFLLPHAIQKSPKILLFSSEKVDHKNIIMGNESHLEQIQQGKIAQDMVMSDIKSFNLLKKLGKYLRSKLPNPKDKTLSSDINKIALEYAKGCRIGSRTNESQISMTCGNTKMNIDDIKDNFHALIDQIASMKPDNLKGELIKGCYLSTTQGHGSIFLTPSLMKKNA